jgi:hypothetical protein
MRPSVEGEYMRFVDGEGWKGVGWWLTRWVRSVVGPNWCGDDNDAVVGLIGAQELK